jgi:hypothetical protein
MNVIPHPARTGADPPNSDGAAVEWPRSGGQREIPLPDQGHPSPAVAEVRAPRRRWRRPLPWLVAGAAVLLAAGGGAYVWLRDGHEAPAVADLGRPEAPPAAEFRLSDLEMRLLRIEEVHAREFRAERMADGRIAYNEDRSTPVFSPYNGRVVRVIAKLGDEIDAGEPLLEVETPPAVRTRSSPSPTFPPCGWWPRCGSGTRRWSAWTSRWRSWWARCQTGASTPR